MVCLDTLVCAVSLGNLHDTLRGNFSEALIERNSRLLEEERHALIHLLGNATTACHNLIERGFHSALELYAIGSSRLEVVIDLSAFEHSLGRDTAPVHAHATQLCLLNNSNRESFLCGFQCGNMSTRTATYNYNIVFHIRKGLF